MIDYNALERYRHASRPEKAKKIANILLDYLGEAGDPGRLSCLDLGCSIGVISDHLSHIFGRVVGIDLDVEAVHIAHQLHTDTEATYIMGSGLVLPFQDHTFDVVICAQVYEHSVQPPRLVREIYRVLKPGGCCFFSGPNRWWPYEYHYHWFFLHWLPQGVLHRYCEMRYGHSFDLVLYNYWQLCALWRGFQSHDYTLKLIYEAEKFWDVAKIARLSHLVPRPLAALFEFLLPNFNWILVKPGAH